MIATKRIIIFGKEFFNFLKHLKINNRDFVIMLRKITFIFLANIWIIDLRSRSLLLILINFVYSNLIQQKMPFVSFSLNTLEYFSNISALIVLFGGIVYYNENDSNMKAIFFLFIFFFNLLFCSFWLTNFTKLIFRRCLFSFFKSNIKIDQNDIFYKRASSFLKSKIKMTFMEKINFLRKMRARGMKLNFTLQKIIFFD